MQVWPLLRVFPQAILFAAAFISAVRLMMQGLLPPSSRTTGVRFLEAASITVRPSAGLPVKKIISQRSCSRAVFTSLCPWIAVMYLSSKVSAIILARTPLVAGTYGEGFRTAVQPAEIAPISGFISSCTG